MEMNSSPRDTNVILAQLVVRNMLAPFTATRVSNNLLIRIAQLERNVEKEAGGIGYRKPKGSTS